MWSDLRIGCRTLLRTPGFTAGVVLTLALAAGVGNALFAAIDAALIRPLPYADPDRLVSLSVATPAGLSALPASYPEYREWSAARVFQSMAGYSRTNRTLTGVPEPARLAVTQVTANFFATLGVTLERGRAFTADEERDGADRVAVVTHGFWRQYLGARPSALGETVRLGGVGYRVVGILPSTFTFSLDSPDLFLPLGIRPLDETARDSHWLEVIGRLAPGATIAQARGGLAAIAAQTSGAARPERIDVVPLRDRIVGDLRLVLFVLAGAALLVMLAAAASAANLMATRAAGPRREMALRTALGGSRAAMLRLVLAEALVLGAAATAVAWLLGRWTSALVLAALPSSVLAGAPYLRSAHVDASVLGVGAVLVALALLPSVVIAFADVARLPLHAALKSGAASARAGSRLPLGGAPVVLQVALAVVLLVGAVLMTRSVGRLLSVPLGFQPDHVVAMSVSLPVERYQTPESVAGFYRDLRSQAARLPGVARVGIVDEMPLTKDTGAVRLHTADRPAASSAEVEALIRSASPGYFETMGIAILAGRDFAETDRDGRPPVAVLSRALASALFPGGQAVGRSVALARNTITFQVAGVVDDVRMGELDRTIRPAIYTCSLQDPSRSTQALVRTTRPAAEMASELRAVVRTIDPDVPVYRVRTMEEALGDTQGVATRRLVLYPLAAFGGLTALIAMFGLYGLLSYAMAQRTRELGIRVALGAETPAILRLAMGQGLGPALTGVVLGLALAAAGTRWLAGVLYGVGPFDAASFAGAAGLVLVISAAAAFVPARRASRVDPCVVLRME